MKQLSVLFSLLLVTLATNAQQSTSKEPDPAKKIMVVETACGECRLGLQGKSCDLAIRMNGKAYFVDGTNIDEHGDAHAKDGFCNAVRKAEVQGELVNGRFQATYFRLLPATAKTGKRKK